ncbi:MAG: hypothetical protein HN350_03155 [Phycisphaerales bacterium]|jgi:hypothetical protein|nr:hypothetical protein [Phycisphaerales bacterium]
MRRWVITCGLLVCLAQTAAGAGAADQLQQLEVGEIVFAVRQVDSDGHWYANFGNWSDRPERKLYHPGGRLCVLNVQSGKVVSLINDPKGGVRDPQVHYDGKKILFSYRKGDAAFYNLYEINTDGSGLRQITKGPQDDIEPSYLPDGGIVFCSSRARRFVQCYFTRVATLYRCDAAGGKLRAISSNIEHDNTPWVLPDGRIIHQRWEYVDRSQLRYHHLWTMNPDGTNQMVFYGNMHPGTLMIDAKPIGNSNKVVASFSPGHGRKEHAGYITIVDPSGGPDDRQRARVICQREMYRDPYPLSENCFLVAGDTDIGVLNAKGKYSKLYTLPDKWAVGATQIHEPRPLRARKRERVIPQRVDLSKATGTVSLQNVYIGRNMGGVKPGEIKKLMIIETLPKPVNFSGGWEPISMGGSFTLQRILGTVPVESDGSANFELPALRSIFFVALDKNDLSVKRMQSFMTLQPGERLSCVGCHENRGKTAPPGKRPLAMRRAASKIERYKNVPDVFDFPRDIQPILDKHCVACHGYAKTPQGGPRSGGVILTGDRGPYYSHSYFSLTVTGQFADGRNGDGNRAPRMIGSSASAIMKKISGAHHKVKLSAHERTMIRLWIDAAATYPGTYAALGTGMIDRTPSLDPKKSFANQKVSAAVSRRCVSCHRGKMRMPSSPGHLIIKGFRRGGHIDPHEPGMRYSSHIVFNLSKPASSLFLLAPLSKQAGGYGICRPIGTDLKKRHDPIFKSTDDADYKLILGAIDDAKNYLEKIKRFDMPGFRPNVHYLREMKAYGILAPKFDLDTGLINPYKTDEKYWRSHWYLPEVK